MTSFVFINPVWLWLLGMIPVVGFLYARYYHKRQIRLEIAYLPKTVKQKYFWGLLVLPTLEITFITLLIICLAEPKQIIGEKIVLQNSYRWYAWIDISASMEKAFENSTAASSAWICFEQMLQACPNDEVGLGVVANYPLIVAPLTYDHQLLQEISRQVPVNQLPKSQSNLSDAILTTIPVFQDSLFSKESAAIVLFTDGASNQGVSLQSVVSVCQKQRISVYTVAIGLDTVKQHIDFQAIKNLSQQTGGICYLIESPKKITDCVKTITKQFRQKQRSRTNPEYRDLGDFLVLAAIVCFLGYLLVMLVGWYNPLEL